MTDKKLTDNEIIKALECCTTNGASCKDCPAFVKVDRSNCKKYFRGALDLINRQKAEIEEQQSEIKILKDSNINLQELYQAQKEKVKTAKQKCIDIAKALKTAKAEAIKEFWNSRPERLNEQCEGREEYNKGWNACLDEFWEIRNNFVKEMVGEDNA